jgi:hypothetical protein
MQTELKLPPSGRDFQVYQRVIVDAASTRQAASEFSLSQTRVRQVVQRVADWLDKELPAASEESDKTKLWLAKHVAADRLQTLLCETMSGWRKSHETKYCGMAIRLITAQSKLPVMPGTLESLAADAIEGPLSDEHEQPEQPTTAVSPPHRDCSPNAEIGSHAISTAWQPPIPTSDHRTGSAELPDDVRGARRAFFEPAQQSVENENYQPVTQLQINPQQPGVLIERPLSRRERRRLARISA